jgi:arabinosaccharide transport system substrate-binding protein
MNFSFGKAPFFLLLLALISGLYVWRSHQRYGVERADLVLLTHARLHADVYARIIPQFEAKHGVRVDVQVMDARALRSRLQAAFLSGAEVPDLVEINENIAYYTRGPLEDIGFLDLTDWIRERGFDKEFVAARFSSYSSRGRIFALPHDVHPVMLAYRADIVEDELGLDPSQWTTWEEFARHARMMTKDLNGNGIPDRYGLEMPPDGRGILRQLLLQRGGGLFNEEGEVLFDDELTVETVLWYLRAALGPERFGFDPGNGQPFYRAMNDGLVLFYFTPDWRSRIFNVYAPSLEGRMKLMPLPAWETGGRRTSTASATGLAVTKASPRRELAKQLAEFLYLQFDDGGEIAADLHILPPARSTWDAPAFDRPYSYYRNQPIMRLYADLASDVPPVWVTPYSMLAEEKLVAAVVNCSLRYRQHGEQGLEEMVRTELRRGADQVREMMARNRFLEDSP